MSTNAINNGATNAVNNGTFGGSSVNDGGSLPTARGGVPVVVAGTPTAGGAVPVVVAGTPLRVGGMPRFGLIGEGHVRNHHQVQLWFWSKDGVFVFEVRQAYVPNGSVVRSCVLDSGSDKHETVAYELGKASFERNK